MTTKKTDTNKADAIEDEVIATTDDTAPSQGNQDDQSGQITEETTEEEKLKTMGLTLLNDYPAEKEIYMTSNGFGFFELNEANTFAATLKNKTVLTVTKQ